MDADVLIHAARGTKIYGSTALELISESNRLMISSNFVVLEVIPKARYNGRTIEERFYRTFFETVNDWITPSSELIRMALDIATEYGLAGMDAIHMATASLGNVEEFITGEKPSSPLFRVPTLRVTSLFDMV